ncbi:ATP-binding cassette domain-containing protein [Streptomyces sp. A3M-1-3]|uniref:ATP-binding cassette domain-containing protein n=1 Tax=Streptomyces sp. A3M-1-3 TaxID=2962044 RepID=UPI0027E51296|nr:ATP-binding cassette domain-containing protein [Streptomyces sp. A3M-1-3]
MGEPGFGGAAPLLVAQGLSKSFHGKRVVDDVSFHLPPGTVTGFLGANGAGKTTTIRMLLGLLHGQGRPCSWEDPWQPGVIPRASRRTASCRRWSAARFPRGEHWLCSARSPLSSPAAACARTSAARRPDGLELAQFALPGSTTQRLE